MRKALLTLTLAVAASGLQAAEATRTLELALQGDPARAFAVENLVGTMRVVPGSGDTARAVAVVHGESEALAASVRFEQVSGEHGVPTLRVRYPVNRYDTYRSPVAKGSSGVLGALFGGGSEVRYDPLRVRGSHHSRVLLYDDVEVQQPANAVEPRCLTRLGP